MNIYDYVIAADFDGTITTCDSNDMLFYKLGTEESKFVEEEYRAGEISGRETFRKHFDLIPMTFEKYYAFLDEYIHIDPTFSRFYYDVLDRSIPFYIVSGGFRQAISHILRQYRIPQSGIFANDIVMKEHLKPLFAQSGSVCTEEFGPCGNCKKTCLENIRRLTGKKILYIGDGITDRCAIKVADFIFAKNILVKYCIELGLDYSEYRNFNDISKQLFTL